MATTSVWIFPWKTSGLVLRHGLVTVWRRRQMRSLVDTEVEKRLVGRR